jgi:hypothetical protein
MHPATSYSFNTPVFWPQEVTISGLTDLAVTEYLGEVANQTEMLALVGQKGDWCSRTDTSTVFVITGDHPDEASSWTELTYPTGGGAVTSVNGATGAVVLDAADVGAATSSHTHVIGDTTGLQTALDGKANTSHTHVIGDVTNLQTELDGKADTSHTHVIGDVTGLQTALDGKANTSHTHVIGDVTGLQTALDGKAASSHTHAISDVTNLQTELDGKADSSHTHAISDVTNLQTSLDAKADETVTITGGSGILGGGDLTTSRTLSVAIGTGLGFAADYLKVNYGTTAGTACEGNDARLSDARTPTAHTHGISDVTNLWGTLNSKADETITISSGAGMTGGGNLTTNRTLSVNAGDGLTTVNGPVEVDPGNGITIDGSGKTAVKLNDLIYNGLLLDAQGLQVHAGNGLGRDASGLFVRLQSNSGLSTNTNGLIIDNDEGLARTVNGLKTSISTNHGLQFDPNTVGAGRAIQVNAGAGLEFESGTGKLKAKAQLFRGAYTLNVANFASSTTGYWLLDMNAPAGRTLISWAIICTTTGSVTLGFLKNGSSSGMPIYTGTSTGSGGNWSGGSLTAGDSLSVYVFATSGSPTDFAVQLNYTQLTEVL